MQTTVTATRVEGFGSGDTEVEAQQAAWDDAIARINRIKGFKEYNVTATRRSVSAVSVDTADGVTEHGYQAVVELQVQRARD